MANLTQRRPSRLSHRRLILFRWIAGLVGLLAGLCLAELAVRVFRLVPPVLPEADEAIVLHYTDPNGLIRLTPNWKGFVAYQMTEISSQGFRDRLFAPRPDPGIVRLAILGDSYMMGDGLPVEKTCAKQLESLLGQRHKVEVMNCGVSATNTENQSKILEQVLDAFHPDLVALSYNINDFQTYRETRFERLKRSGYRFTVESDGRVKVIKDLSLIARAKLAVRDRSYLVRWLLKAKDLIFQQEHAQVDYDPLTRVQGWIDSGGVERSFAALEEMRNLCNRRGVPFFVFVIPNLLDVPSSVPTLDDYPFRQHHALIEERLQALSVEFVDVLPDFAGQQPRALAVHPFDRHFNAKGIEIIANAIAKPLELKIEQLQQVRAQSH